MSRTRIPTQGLPHPGSALRRRRRWAGLAVLVASVLLGGWVAVGALGSAVATRGVDSGQTNVPAPTRTAGGVTDGSFAVTLDQLDSQPTSSVSDPARDDHPDGSRHGGHSLADGFTLRE